MPSFEIAPDHFAAGFTCLLSDQFPLSFSVCNGLQEVIRSSTSLALFMKLLKNEMFRRSAI